LIKVLIITAQWVAAWFAAKYNQHENKKVGNSGFMSVIKLNQFYFGNICRN